MDDFLSAHFLSVTRSLCSSPWTPQSVAWAAFDVLVRASPRVAWKFHQEVFQVIIPLVSPEQYILKPVG